MSRTCAIVAAAGTLTLAVPVNAVAVSEKSLTSTVAGETAARAAHRSGQPSDVPLGNTPPTKTPTGPPLVSGSSAYAVPSRPAGESESESVADSEDPLVRNGLRSPLCKLIAAELPGTVAGDCETSGFLAASAPSQDYGFDTNIDTTLGFSVDALLQDYLVKPIWMSLVWLVDALLVALEWSYALELLRGSLADGVGGLLRSAEALFTNPWLASLLALAGVLAAYNGIVRRKVAQTLGEAAAMLAMIAAAMFVIADPAGTVGALSQWSDEASAGSLSAMAGGGTSRPYAALAESMQQFYAAAIQAPWCYLEFGDVSWCENAGRLDPRLHSAALRIARETEAEIKQSGVGGSYGQALARRVQLLRQARTNGAIFLALTPNRVLRNSVKVEGSLLYVLCGGGKDATECRGPTAAQAEFRANSGTLPRIGGVIVIALGLLGALALVGFVVMRLLEAAILSVLFLMLSPVAALAPTLGEAGRTVFKRWAMRLLGAAMAKLVWSVVLAALLVTMRILLDLEGLGWLTQWLLMSTLWWGVFLRRHGLLVVLSGRGAAELHRTDTSKLMEERFAALGSKAGRSAFRGWHEHSRRRSERKLNKREAELRRREEQQQAREEERRKGPPRKPSTTLRDGFVQGAPPSSEHTERDRGRDRMPLVTERLCTEDEQRLMSTSSGSEPTLTPRVPRPRFAPTQPTNEHAARERVAGEQVHGRAAKEQAVSGPIANEQAASGPIAHEQAAGRRVARGHAAAGRYADARRPSSAQDRTMASEAKAERTQLDRDVSARQQPRTGLAHPILRDAFEVAQRRKRQLGYGEPQEQQE